MKKLFFLIAILFSISSIGQVYQTTSVYGIQYKREKTDSCWHPPFVTSLTVLDNISYPALAIYRTDTALWLSKTGTTYTIKIFDQRDTLTTGKLVSKHYLDSMLTGSMGSQDLQDVTDNGATTDNDITIDNGTGAKTSVTSGQILLYNAATPSFRGQIGTASITTANKFWTFPNATGTVALTSDYTFQTVTDNGATTTHKTKVLSGGDEKTWVDAGNIICGTTLQTPSSGYISFEGIGGMPEESGYSIQWRHPSSSSSTYLRAKINTEGTKSIYLPVQGGIAVVSDTIYTATDAAYTLIDKKMQILKLPDITANRTLTVGSGLYFGLIVKIWNQNTTGNAWSFGGGLVKDASNSTITTLTNSTWYILEWDGTNWLKIN